MLAFVRLVTVTYVKFVKTSVSLNPWVTNMCDSDKEPETNRKYGNRTKGRDIQRYVVVPGNKFGCIMIKQCRSNCTLSAERIETWIQRLIARTGEHRMSSPRPPTCSKHRI